MKAKIFPLLFLGLFATNLFGQNLPDWIYTAPADYSYTSSDINTRNGHLFVQYSVTEIFPCNSNHATSVLIDDLGNLVWENVFDTTNGCQMEFSRECRIITSPTTSYYTASPYYLWNPDSVYTIMYNHVGLAMSSNYVGFNFHAVENMNDGYCYQANSKRLVFKADSLGNVIWQYNLPDSNNFSRLYCSPYTQRVLVTTVDYSQSTTDYNVCFIGFDTSGFVHFNNSINLVQNANEVPEHIWFTNDRKIIGLLSAPSSTLHFFSLDTAANLNFPMIDIQTPISIKPVYDSIHNLLHFFKPLGAGTGKIYSLDCSTGIIQDSLFLDSIIIPELAVDHAGNLLVASRYAQNNSYAFYVKRFTYNYYLDWTGVVTSPYANASTCYDVKTDTSNGVFLFYKYNTLAHVAKFTPPLVSSLSEHTSERESLSIYPNPSISEVSIRKKKASTSASQLIIRTVSGQIVKEISIPLFQTSYTFDTTDFPAGVYFVEWGNGNASKLIVIH
jgi:hypothetical protein